MATHGYAGCCRTCGGWLVLVTDEYARRHQIAKEIAECISDGMEVKRVTIEEGRAMEMCQNSCPGRGEQQAELPLGGES